MAITEITHESWFGRLGKSIKGILVGIVLVLGSIVLLFWNEGRAVKRAKTIEEGAGAVVSVDSAAVAPANEGKLIHVTGQATTDETLTDAQFAVSTRAIRLRRRAEMYQWQEKKTSRSRKKLGGGRTTETTYTYSKVWSERPIDSSGFRDSDKRNPERMRFTSRDQAAGKVTLGAFTLSKSLITQMRNFRRLPVTVDLAERLPEAFQNELRIRDGRYYLPTDPNAGLSSQAIGDLRISFHVVDPGPGSVIAQQAGSTFTPYVAATGQKIDMLSEGTHTAEAMFQAEREANVTLTWILRGAGVVAMLIGFLLMLKPLVVLGDVVPFIGNLLGAGAFLIALVLSLVISLVTIALGWVFYRPLVGIALLAAAAAVFFGIRYLIKSRKKTAPAVPPPPPPAKPG